MSLLEQKLGDIFRTLDAAAKTRQEPGGLECIERITGSNTDCVPSFYLGTSIV
jgi:hypothetical protein